MYLPQANRLPSLVTARWVHTPVLTAAALSITFTGSALDTSSGEPGKALLTFRPQTQREPSSRMA